MGIPIFDCSSKPVRLEALLYIYIYIYIYICMYIDKMCLKLKEILFLTIFDSNLNATSVNTMINVDYNHLRS